MGGYFEGDEFEEWVIDFGDVALVLHFGWLGVEVLVVVMWGGY